MAFAYSQGQAAFLFHNAKGHKLSSNRSCYRHFWI